MSMSNSGGEPRGPMNPSGHHPPGPPDRRRRGKNPTGSYYNGPRDGRMNYRSDSRMSNRSGAGGDGPHNGSSGYRGGDYDSQPQSSPEHHPRNGHSSSYQYHSQRGDYQKNQGGSRGDGIPSDYEGLPPPGVSRRLEPPRMGGMQPPPLPQQDPCQQSAPHAPHPPMPAPPPGFSGQEIIPQQIDPSAHFPPMNVLHHNVHMQGHPGFPPPPSAPNPGVNFFGCHPNSQPMYGTLALCHIPFGINPSAVISPVVYTQIIGSGMLTPGLPYSVPCSFAAPIMHTHSVVMQNPQHHHHHIPPPLPPPQAVSSNECMVFLDPTPAMLNPDADAFFPPAFPPEEDDHPIPDVSLELIDIKSEEDTMNLASPEKSTDDEKSEGSPSPKVDDEDNSQD